MADTKVSALSALTGANLASGDLIAVVDVSDTTMAASGTDKKMTAAEAGIGLANFLPIASASVSLSTHVPNNTTFEQWATEEAVIAQADCPASAVVLATLTGRITPGPGSPAINDRGSVKLQVSFDGGSNFADIGQAMTATLLSTNAANSVPLAINARGTGTVTGDIQVRAMCRDVDQANDISFSLGEIVVMVHPQ